MHLDHLRYAGLCYEHQRQALESIIRETPELMTVLQRLHRIELPDHLVGGGAIYQTVWNVLTRRSRRHGIKDIDVIYFDGSDLSYDAEVRVINALKDLFSDVEIPVEVRNQARVHLWFATRFGFPVSPLTRSKDALLRYCTKAHAVAVRLEDGDRLHIEAPFGLEDVFAFRIAPNYALANRRSHEEKAARAKRVWPEVEVHAW